jgi:type VI secretion system protein
MAQGPRGTLLSRIRKPETAGPQQSASDRDLRDSILQNLEHMCMTRVGTMLTAPDYGIADVSEMVHAFPDAIAMMSQTLRHTIQTYEPRLQGVQIIHIPNENGELTLKFEIRAKVASQVSKQTIKFETTLDPSRKFSIR